LGFRRRGFRRRRKLLLCPPVTPFPPLLHLAAAEEPWGFRIIQGYGPYGLFPSRALVEGDWIAHSVAAPRGVSPTVPPYAPALSVLSRPRRARAPSGPPTRAPLPLAVRNSTVLWAASSNSGCQRLSAVVPTPCARPPQDVYLTLLDVAVALRHLHSLHLVHRGAF
jgi:hypothetical protein